MHKKILATRKPINNHENNVLELEEKLAYLSKVNPAFKKMPNKPNAILVFGSPRTETPQKVVELIEQNSDWEDVPIIISGKGKDEKITEAESFLEIIKNKGIKNPIFLDKEATRTGENVINMKKILVEQKISPENLLVVNFAILSRSSYNRLREAGINDIYVVSADINFEENKTILDYEEWIDFHYKKQKEYDQNNLPATQ
ncbi:YdcF family protein [Candidatus Margulisiibacteriota bacterium]